MKKPKLKFLEQKMKPGLELESVMESGQEQALVMESGLGEESEEELEEAGLLLVVLPGEPECWPEPEMLRTLMP